MDCRFKVLLLVCAAALLGVLVWVSLSTVPSFESAKSASAGSDSWLLDRSGEVLQRLRVDYSKRQLRWVSLSEVSPALARAVVAAEDQRFYAHFGVDGLALAGAAAQRLGLRQGGGPRRGASTISMQVAGLLFASDSGVPGQRSLWQKLNQMRWALALEAAWSKAQILEVYLNRVNFRHELVGVDAAALGVFQVGADALDAAQAALLAVMLRAPSAGRARLGARACVLLERLAQGEHCERVRYLAAVLPARPYALDGPQLAPHLARRMISKPNVRLRSTINGALQRFASATLRQYVADLAERNVHDGAVVVLDNASAEVLAYVGSSGPLSEAPQFDAVLARRQPGSALKPFLYATALDQGWLTAASLLEDAPVALATPLGLYTPQNYDRDFKGAVTVRSALASSLNVPAVRTLMHVSVPAFYQKLRALGLDTLTADAQHYGLGLALGDGEVTLLALANAYRALANGGVGSPVRTLMDRDASLETEGQARRVFSPASSFIVADILSDNAARAATFGFNSVLATRGWAAVKTGTSQAMRDNWAVGFTQRYTVGVWVGNASGEPMWDVSGMSGAAPIWQALVDYLHAFSPSRRPAPPEGLEARTVTLDPRDGGYQEWFIAGTAPEQPWVRPAPLLDAPSLARLLEPADGMVVAPDPDVPARRQRILVQSSLADPSLCLQLDAQAPLGCGSAQWLLALPAAGEHELRLLGRDGRVVDRRSFTVRPG